VFPSRTDTFGLVLLEALASGVPVAAFPAAAPRDVIGEAPVGTLDEHLGRACLAALECSREESLNMWRRRRAGSGRRRPWWPRRTNLRYSGER
jgi:glycosyltransferase involved in cell wall biosynthesis